MENNFLKILLIEGREEFVATIGHMLAEAKGMTCELVETRLKTDFTVE